MAHLRGKCPICGRTYTGKNPGTRHHIFPRMWWRIGLKVPACHECHQEEFHKLYKMIKKWTKRGCVKKWIDFCASKGKDAYKIYPQLTNWESAT